MSLKFQNKLLQESTIVIRLENNNNKTIKATQTPLHIQRTAQTEKKGEKHNIL